MDTNINSNNINEYFDNSVKKIKKKIGDKLDIFQNLHYDLEFYVDDTDKFIVDVFYKNNCILKGYYEILGCYNTVSSTWWWAYGTNTEQNLSVSSKNIKKIYKNIKKSNANIEDKYLFYSANTSFFIGYKNLMDVLKFGLWATNSVCVLSRQLRESDNTEKNDIGIIIEFIILKEIIQY
jgi:hypothetical protein